MDWARASVKFRTGCVRPRKTVNWFPAVDKEGVPHCLSTAGNLFTVFLGRTEPVRNFADARAQSTAAYAAFFHAMLDGGVYLPPSAFEAWFVSAAHDEAALSRIADALPAAARAAAVALG